jgi:L-gulonolactone oxidase
MAQPRKVNNRWAFIFIISLQVYVCSAACPPPPVQCASKGCHLTNYRGLWEGENSCKVAKAVFPKTEDELLREVADAVKKGRKMKVISAGSHSLNRFACPGGDGGVVISSRDYNARIMVDEKSMTVTVDAGVELRKLIDTLASKGLAFPQTTDWDFISMAGIVSTAAHGSGLWGKGGGIHEYVVGMSLVVPAPANEGYAKLLHLTNNDEDLKAARVSLGVLGAISQLTFKVEKMFKRSVTLDLKDDSDLEESFVSFAKAHEFGLIAWYPSLRQALYTIQDRVSVQVAGNGKVSNPFFQPATVQTVVQTRANGEEFH